MKLNFKIYTSFLLLFFSLLLSGCHLEEKEHTKVKDLEFTIMCEERLPEELKKILTEKQTEPFQLTFQDKDFLYICIGYGPRETSGYSITVNELYLSKKAVCVDTNLLGPSKEFKEDPTPSYPYIVIKTTLTDRPVLFL